MFKPTKRIEGAHEEGIWAVKWKGDHICTGSLDGTVKLWKNNLSLNATSSPQKLGITSVSILNNLSMVISCCQDSTIQFHDISDFNSTQTIRPGLLEAWTISVSPNDLLVVGGSQTGAVNVWSVQDKSRVNTFETGNKLITDTAFSPGGDKLAAVGIDGMLNIFDVEGGKCIFQTEAHALPARCVKFSPDGNLVYTASADRHVNVFDLTHQIAVNSFSHSGMTLSLDISPDNRHFISSCSNHSVHYWDIGMQRCMQSFDTQHSDQVWGVCFNEAGDKFVSVGDDSSMQLYENTSSSK
jgi:WD repeat-containing protein 61